LFLYYDTAIFYRGLASKYNTNPYHTNF